MLIDLDEAPDGDLGPMVPPPSRPGAYVAKRHAIAALWAECDALWEAMTESERDRAVTALGADWRPRRG